MRALVALVLLALPAGDDTVDLRRFLARYRSGAIRASVIGRMIPSEDPPPAFPSYERARAKMRANPTPREAALLLEAAVLSLADPPHLELERFAAQQPWVIRRRALDDLCQFYTDAPIQAWALGLCADQALPGRERRALTEYLGAALAREPRPETYSHLLAALGHGDSSVRAAAAEGLAPALRAEHLLRLVRGLFDSEPRVRLHTARALEVAMARTLDELPAQRRSRVLQLIASRLNDADAHVRILLAELLTAHPDPIMVPALIAALAQEEERRERGEGRLRIQIALEDGLHRITGRGAPPLSAEQWRDWLERRRDDAPEVTEEDQKRTSADPIKRSFATYFGREVRSDHVVFILDISGSMRRRAGTTAHDRGEGKRDPASRIALARRELFGYLKAVDETKHFNVVVFAVGARAAFDTLVPATRENKERARAFAVGFPLGGETDLFSGIVHGLRCAGLGGDVRFGTRADTAYLLSDGIPTAGAVTDPGDITRMITRMNQGSGLRIHVVDLGARHSAFQKHLRSLALQNDGEYIRP